MKGLKKIVVVLGVSLVGAMSAFGATGGECERLLAELDKTIAERERYIDKKYERIWGLKQQLFDNGEVAEVERFRLYRALTEEYIPFKFDSAYYFATHTIELAKLLGEWEAEAECRITLANILMTGYRCDAADWVPADFWAEAIAALRGAFPEKEILMLAEGAEMSNFEAGFDMNYAWNYYDTLESVFKGQSANKIFKTHESEYAAIPEGAVKLRFTTNHDKTAYNGTPIEIYGGREGSLAALTITTLMGGAPMLYASQECAQSTALDFMKYFDYDWAKDLDYTAKVKQIMAIRKDNKIFSKSRIQDFSGSHYVMFYRLDYPAEALVLVNVRNSEQLVTIPSAHAGKTMTDALTSESINLPEEITLGAYEYKIWIK